jgi:hypothetical protein
LVRRAAKRRFVPETEVAAESKRADSLETVLNTLCSLAQCLVRLRDSIRGFRGSRGCLGSQALCFNGRLLRLTGCRLGLVGAALDLLRGGVGLLDRVEDLFQLIL